MYIYTHTHWLSYAEETLGNTPTPSEMNGLLLRLRHFLGLRLLRLLPKDFGITQPGGSLLVLCFCYCCCYYFVGCFCCRCWRCFSRLKFNFESFGRKFCGMFSLCIWRDDKNMKYEHRIQCNLFWLFNKATFQREREIYNRTFQILVLV